MTSHDDVTLPFRSPVGISRRQYSRVPLRAFAFPAATAGQEEPGASGSAEGGSAADETASRREADKRATMTSR